MADRDADRRGRTTPGLTPARLADGGLAAGALLAVTAVARRRGSRLRAGPALAGALGAVLLEWALARRHDLVRRWWGRPGTKAGSVAGLAAGTWLAARFDESGALSTVAGGLAAYLAVLVLVAAGVVPPPWAWRDALTPRTDGSDPGTP